MNGKRKNGSAILMLTKLLMAWCLMALCVVVHSSGLIAALKWAPRTRVDKTLGFWAGTWLLVRLASWIIFFHLLEIVLWALYYAWNEALTDLHSAFYFSVVTYTTVGYGDLVLPREWRLVGGVEALTGILMCGLSTGFFFAVLSRLHRDPTSHAQR